MNGINNFWLVIGIIFVALGIKDLLYYGFTLGVFLNLIIGSLVVHTSVYNMGGWSTVRYKIKRFFR